jgi:hypothetical protein
MSPEQMARYQADVHEQDDERAVELAALRERVKAWERVAHSAAVLLSDGIQRGEPQAALRAYEILYGALTD